MATSKDENGNNTVLIAVVVIALVLGAVALIISIVSISNNSNSGGSSQDNGGSSGTYSQKSGGSSEGDRVWQLSFEHTGGPYGYIDDASGELRGLTVDLTNKVCQIAGKNCELVYDSPQRCWTSQPGGRAQGGDGLFGGYYDACVGWLKTYDRPRTFKFTQPYSKDIIVVFVVKKGKTGFVWTDLTDSKIGFIDGWAYSSLCVARESDRITGADLSVDQIVHYAGRDQLLAGLLNDEIDALFDYKEGFPALDERTEVASDDITSCLQAGDSVMVRKDSGLVEWWNDAFDKLTATSEWRAICNDLLDEHGHLPGPQPENYCVKY